jgi:Tubulin-tyrosine ligase family
MGFDFLIDEDFRVWLIEVNTNPYFGVKNAAMPNFIDNLVDDTFKLTLDKTFKVGGELPRGSENLYELLYSPVSGINKRRDFNESFYPVAKIRE